MCELSIVMPVYNAQDFLNEKLQQICQNLTEEIELIVINDGSTDQSLNICNNRLSKRKNTHIISQNNMGLSCARNRGLTEATGDYIMFLDCDDGLAFETIENILQILRKKKPDVLMGKYYLQSPFGVTLPNSCDFLEDVANPLNFIYYKVSDSIWNVWRYICKKSFLIEHDLWFVPGILCEDVEWTPRMLEQANHIVFFNQPFYFYFYRSDSITHTVSFKKTLDLNNTIQTNLTRYQGKAYCSGLYKRLVRESFYSLSDYHCFAKEQRCLLKGIIASIGSYYKQFGPILARFFIHTQPYVPIFIWSCALDCAKKIRKIFRRFIHSHAWQQQ